MQVCCVNPQPFIRPPSDIEKIKSELAIIDKLMKDVEDGKSTTETYEGLKDAIGVINGIILSVDNSNAIYKLMRNRIHAGTHPMRISTFAEMQPTQCASGTDFFKVGGFNRILPLLNCPNADVVTAISELTADLCQNNKFCQSKAIEFGILPELVKQLDNPLDSNIRLKSLYALSCLCRNNEESIKYLSETNAVQVLLKILQEPHEKLRAKTAFFITYLSNYEVFREAFYSADLVPIIIKLLEKWQDSSTEHLLGALANQVSKHVQSRVQCVSKEYNLLEILRAKTEFFDSEEQFEESLEHCGRLYLLCFNDVKNDS